MSRLVAYLRVSTDEQGESGPAGFAEQADAVEVYCASQGHELTGMVRETEAARGARPILEEVLQSVERGHHHGVVVSALDRLSNSVLQVTQIHERLGKADAILIALDVDLNTSTASGRMMMNMLATVAQWERDTISERTRRSLRAKQARGEHVGRRRVIGDDVRLLAQDLRASGLTYREINEALIAAGHLPPSGVRRWQISTIQRLLSQEVRRP